MSEKSFVSPGINFEGSMYLYQQPELLTQDEHGSLGLSQVDRPFDFAKGVQAIPIAITEVKAIQRHYPIVFSDFENPALLAVLGICIFPPIFVVTHSRWLQTKRGNPSASSIALPRALLSNLNCRSSMLVA
jgi:hypothetical protein